jgi:hypothetical protein
MTWYEFKSWSLTIEPVQIERESGSRVYFAALPGKRAGFASKHSEYSSYFPTREEAVSFAKDKLVKRIEKANRELEEAKRMLGRLEVAS